MKKPVRWLAFAVLAASLPFAARFLGDETLCGGFLPENDLKIPVGDVRAAGISEAVFNRLLDRAEQVYGPVVAAKGGKLSVNRLWTNPTVNASAYRMGSTWHINMYGGLARHSAITEEGFALVACHELGHHLGGYPKSYGWGTNEGGADYFATLKCLRRVLPADAPQPVDPVAAAACGERWPEEASRGLCQGGTMAGVSVAALFQALRPSPQPPSLATPDPSIVSSMYDSHPQGQCRLDTYFQGALCAKPIEEDVSDSDPAVGTCTRKGGYSVGLRPRCWYKPPADEPLPAAPAMASREELKDAERLKERVEALRAAFSGRGV